MAFAPNLGLFARAIRLGAPVAVAACCGLSAQAEPASSPQAQSPAATDAGDSANGRCVMTPVAEGFLRLDTRSGQVSLCTLKAGQAQCRASADERAALEAEIDRLAKENAALKGQAPKAAQDSQAAPDSKSAQDDEDRRFDHAMDRVEKFVRRMMQIFRDQSGDKSPGQPL